jgi:hypothetical protein
MNESEYGPLADLVKYSGMLMSAGLAIGLAWRRRANWEPCEEDVPKGPSRVAGLLSAIAIAIVWSEYSTLAAKDGLTKAAVILGVCALMFLLFYGFLIANQVFEEKFSPKKNKVETRKVVGGFRLTVEAKKQLRKAGSVQQLFEGSAYKPDLVWTRGSRSLAKQAFALAYIGLNLSGTMALSCAALLFLLTSSAKKG